jgi:hypothetical protein
MLSIYLRDLVVEHDNLLEENTCRSLGEMLQHNQTVERLELWGPLIDPKGLQVMINELKHNRKLKVIHLSHENISIETEEDFIGMLHQNYFLETLQLPSFSREDIMEKIQFYLRLNATCLRRLMLNINASREQIFDKLVVHSENVNYLFHILRGNPLFLQSTDA